MGKAKITIILTTSKDEYGCNVVNTTTNYSGVHDFDPIVVADILRETRRDFVAQTKEMLKDAPIELRRKFNDEIAEGVEQKIINAIYECVEILGGKSDILGTIGSWHDTISDEDVLAGLVAWIDVNKN